MMYLKEKLVRFIVLYLFTREISWTVRNMEMEYISGTKINFI